MGKVYLIAPKIAKYKHNSSR